MKSDEASYFLNVAVIGGTLLALSFVTLQFFLADLLKRYESTALPVFPSRDFETSEQPSEHLDLPDSLKDQVLFDGDPLVIFMAFSVAVTWIQFVVPLTIGLTAAWLGGHLALLAVELLLLLGAFAFSFCTRTKAIKRLRPYLTREELLWPLLGATLLFFYAVAVGVALASVTPFLARFRVWNSWGIRNDDASLFVLKVVCLLSLLGGTYTTNKDMFIFFKSVAAERMRERWLEVFAHERYPNLKKRVEIAKVKMEMDTQREELVQKWNDGRPEMTSTHNAFMKRGQTYLTRVWQDLVAARRGAPIWLLNVPRIANWEAEVEQLLENGGDPQNIDRWLR